MMICPKHGRQSFLQISDKLYDAFLNKKNRAIKSISFLVEGLEGLDHFMCSEETLDWVIPNMTYDYFSLHFAKISTAKPVCLSCFQEYLNKHKIQVKNVSIKVIG